MKQVHVFDTRAAAGMLTALLDAEGIDYIVSADDCGGVEPPLVLSSGVAIFVSDEDYERASGLLSSSDDR